tara:strand:+ start:85 stop:471 length:387 start_codon:yes stop_codon:yes gene_type:complete
VRLSNNGKKALYIDAENAGEILAFIKSKPSFQNKFKNIQELILEHNMPPRDLYDKEDFEKGCEHITAMKLAKGKDNPRIYCQQYSHKGKERFVIIASELLEKKKSQGLTNKEKQLIRKVAKYDYELED